jgi:hypothetical protein
LETYIRNPNSYLRIHFKIKIRLSELPLVL